MSDAPDDLGIPMKPARSGGQAGNVAPLGRAPGAVPQRSPEPARAGEGARANEPSRPAMPGSAGQAAPRPDDGEARKLIVGRDISLSGEISSCDRLIVEGSVEANVQNCRDIDIAETGLFKGTASIEEAEVRGRFEGNLVCRKRLFIRATGRVTGTIRYGQIEIECGGQISGDVQAQADEFMAEASGARVAF